MGPMLITFDEVVGRNARSHNTVVQNTIRIPLQLWQIVHRSAKELSI